MRSVKLAALLLVMSLPACSREAAPAAREAPMVVRVATIGANRDAPVLTAMGTVAWRRETPLGFTTDGQIARILVNEGDRVRKGQLLATLSTTPLNAGLAVANAESTRARAEYTRVANLFQKGWVTRARLEAAQAAADSAAANVSTRRYGLDTARITAVSDGVILARLAEPSQVIGAGTPVLLLGEAASGHILRAPVNDRDLARISSGAPVEVSLPALGNSPLAGQISEMGGKASRATGTFDIEVRLPADARLRSGMIGTAKISVQTQAAAAPPLVPAAAIIAPRAGEAFVYVIDASKRARLRRIQIEEMLDTGVRVRSGIAPGERVALSGFDRLSDGMIVTPVQRAP